MAALQTVPGVEVHHHDAATGRIVVTQETEATADPEREMKRLQELPDVVRVDLVYHYVEPAEVGDAR
jgi:nitrate reductase NapAB chaperone NapD